MTPRRRSTTLTDPQIKVLKVIEDYQNSERFSPFYPRYPGYGEFLVDISGKLLPRAT